MYTTTVRVQTQDGVHFSDIHSYLVTERFSVPIVGQVEPVMAEQFKARLLFLSSQDPEREIFVDIDSPGGQVTAGLKMYDMMKFVPNPITTMVIGQAASMGAFLLAGGDKGRRFATPNSEIMIHQPLGGFQGQASDIQIHAKHILEMKEKLNRILSESSNLNYEDMCQATDRDNFLSPEAALEMGIIDRIITSQKDIG